MARKVSFWTRKVVKKPTRVRFVNQYGELVSFKATKKITVPKKVTFYTNKPRRRKKW